MLELRFLGQQRIVVDGVNRTGDVPPRSTGLACWLACRRGGEQSRAGLAAMLWPESTGEQSLTNLRRELHLLRRQLPEFAAGLTTSGGLVRWDPGKGTVCDVVSFVTESDRAGRAAVEARPDPLVSHSVVALRVYGGDLLPAWSDDWVLAERERLHRRCLDLIDLLVPQLRLSDPGRALSYAQRRIEMEPLQEPGYRTVMALQSEVGDRAGALRTFHRCASLLDRELGVAPDPATVSLYDALAATQDPGTLARPGQRGVGRARIPLVGRADELSGIRRRWEAAKDGTMGVHLITGDAGVGKTRLMAELASEVGRSGNIVARARCFESGARLALAPLAEWLGSRHLAAGRSRLEPAWADEVERLVPSGGVSPHGPPQPMTDAWQRHRFLEGLVHAVLAPARPTLLTLDDIQWCDAETLAWLQLLARHARASPLMILACARDEPFDDNVELVGLLRALERDGQFTRTALPPLAPSSAAELARQVGATVDDEVALYEATMGFPLFIIEAARASSDGRRPAANALVGSARVQAVLDERLARLSDDAASVAWLVAVVGRDCTLELLQEASDRPEESVIGGLDELWRRRLVVQHSRGSYDFAHDLLRDAVVRQIPTPRLALLHRRVAQALELSAGTQPGAFAASIAHHYEQAGVEHRALPFHIAAAEFASSRFANDDAIEHYQEAVRLLGAVPAGPDRDRRELAVRHAMSQPINARRGYASPLLQETMERAVILADSLDDGHLRASSLVGLFSPYVVQGRLQEAYDVALRALDVSGPYPDVIGQAHFSLAGAATMLGRLDEAMRHFDVVPELTMDHPAALVGTRPEVHSRAWQAHALWLVGRPAEARELVEWAVRRSEEVDHPYSLAVALAYAAMLAQYDQRREDAGILAAQTLVLCDRFGFAYYGDWSTVLAGWAEGGARGLAAIERGLRGLEAQGAQLRHPYYLTLYADVLLSLGKPARARAALEAARADALRRGDVTWLPEVLRRLADHGTSRERVVLLKAALEAAYAQGSHAHVPAIEKSLSSLPNPRRIRDNGRTLAERPAP